MQFRNFRLAAEAYEWARVCLFHGFAVEGPFMTLQGWGVTWHKRRSR